MTEGIEIQTTTELVRHIIDHWESEKIKALKEEEAQKEKLSIEILKEKNLTAKLKKARLVAAQMEADFLKIEARTEGEKRAMIEVASIQKKDVLSGKVTLAEFYKTGKTKEQIYNEAVKQTVEEMGQSLQAARAKNLEILNFEKELLETQTKIRYLIIEPGRTLQRSLKNLAQFAEREIGLFLEEVHSSKTALEQVKGKLLLASKGQSLTPGFSWTRLSLEQARKIQFDPVLPDSLVSKLKKELSKFDDSEILNINYYIRSQSINVNSISLGGKK